MRYPGPYFAAFMVFLMVAFAGVSQAQIVAFGASNVSGYGVSPSSAFPAQLERMLREKGYKVRVENAGKYGNTTSGMLRRVDSAIPSGTRIVILDTSGGFFNDRRFGISPERGQANMSAIETWLRSRGITVIPATAADIPVTPAYRQADRVHLNAQGHLLLATRLLPEVISSLAVMRVQPQATRINPATGLVWAPAADGPETYRAQCEL